MVTLACQGTGWYSGRQLFPIFRHTFSCTAAPGTASVVVGFNQTTRGPTSAQIEPGDNDRKHTFSDIVRFTCGVCAGTYALSGTRIAGDVGHNAGCTSSSCGRSSFVDYLRSLWTDWPLP